MIDSRVKIVLTPFICEDLHRTRHSYARCCTPSNQDVVLSVRLKVRDIVAGVPDAQIYLSTLPRHMESTENPKHHVGWDGCPVPFHEDTPGTCVVTTKDFWTNLRY